MIPEFPEFKNLELSDKEEIEDLTRPFPPYSDFHFITIYCWDIDNNTLISMLNGNLIIKQIDCLSDEQFFSFIGVNSVPETVSKISSFLRDKKLPLIFRWMPEVTVNCLNGLKASISDDRDFFDYIYNVSDIYHSVGAKYKNYKWNISHFNRNYPQISTHVLDLTNSHVKMQLNELFKIWTEIKGSESKDCDPTSEYKALNKLLSTANHFKNLVGIGVYDKDDMIGFCINELPENDYASLLFWKANTKYSGIYQFLMKETTYLCHKNAIPFINFESDLGIESLRVSKLRNHPAFFLKKYKIEIYN